MSGFRQANLGRYFRLSGWPHDQGKGPFLPGRQLSVIERRRQSAVARPSLRGPTIPLTGKLIRPSRPTGDVSLTCSAQLTDKIEVISD
jgi:hypothetical protein